VEPESHRLDREAMLADRLAVAERVRREVDEAVVAAAEKRRAYFDQFMNRIRFEAEAQRERERIVASIEAAFASAADSEPASPGASGSDQWEESEAEPLPLAWAVGAG
jgi:hypothetical protein